MKRSIWIFVVACVVSLIGTNAHAATTITIFAGNTKSGFSGDGGPALGAQFMGCRGIAFDSKGNLYVCDTANNRIRKIDGAGNISTFAGNGTPGFSGDGGPATSAQFDAPRNVAVDSSTGAVYIADENNCRIRCVDSTGTISTIAGTGQDSVQGVGGPAASAGIGRPHDLALDSFNRIHFRSQEQIYGIDGGTLLLIAGDGLGNGFGGDGGPAVNAKFNTIGGLRFDAANNLYVVDANNNRIRKIDVNGIITTVAGTGTAGFSGDGGPATAALLGFPGDDIVIDKAGNVYFGDYGASEEEPRLRKIDTSGIITTVAGNGLPGLPTAGADPLTGKFVGVAGLAIDAAGDIFIAASTDLQEDPKDLGAGIFRIALNTPTFAKNPDSGLAVEVLNQTGGLVALAVNPDTLLREPISISTDFQDIPGRSSIATGTRPTHQFIQAGLFVSTSTATDDANGQSLGKMRKTLAVSRSNTGESALVTGAPNSRNIDAFQLKGKFLFTDTKPDAVTFSGTIELPAGLDLSQSQALSFGVGNIIDAVAMDPKGKALLPSEKNILKKASIKYPKPGNGTFTTAGQKAKLSLQYSLADMDAAGFDTEGISPVARQRDPLAKSFPRAIQCAVLIAGVTYELKAPVAFKVSKGAESGQIQGRSAK